MDRDLLHALSEADAIAASEQEVRDILLSEAQKYHKEVQFDGLGSVLIRVNQSRGPKVMVCAHMDEVGFMVRSVSRDGAIDVLPIGNGRMMEKTLTICVSTLARRRRRRCSPPVSTQATA